MHTYSAFLEIIQELKELKSIFYTLAGIKRYLC